MARVPLFDPLDPTLDPQAQAVLMTAREGYGRDFNIYRVMANQPQAMVAFTNLAAATYQAGRITPKEAELAYTTASVVNRCYY